MYETLTPKELCKALHTDEKTVCPERKQRSASSGMAKMC